MIFVLLFVAGGGGAGGGAGGSAGGAAADVLVVVICLDLFRSSFLPWFDNIDFSPRSTIVSARSIVLVRKTSHVL